MAYQRFLTKNDYYGLITEEGLGSLIRGDEGRLAQAEQRAEMKIVDYLDQFYEIAVALEKGKRIKEYSNLITYPSGVFFKYEGKIWRTCRSMNALHKPTLVKYWEKLDELAMPAEQIEDIKVEVFPYLQVKTYRPGDKVSYLGATWKCLVANGWDFLNIQIPGIVYWKDVECKEWIANHHYNLHECVKYQGQCYTVVKIEETTDWSDNPAVNDAFGAIADYDDGYDYSVDAYDYVVAENTVFLPVLCPNADEPEENINIVPDDPRNCNLVNYMSAIALYYLNALIAPTNIPQTRVDMFNEAMIWVESAAKMKLDPHIPRKIDKEKNSPKDDWAMATFETNMATQVNSPWFV